MKHKHYDLIIAWANGAEIQYLGYDLECAELKRLGLGKDCETRVWLDCDNAPNWYNDFEYRIKPETKPDVVFYGRLTNPNSYVDALWTGCNPASCCNVKVVFDGETGVLKIAEVIE